ncbi:MAG: hypothetical protein A2W91_01330 [Bacteroidetes bacterium GWF2_38_335]|nr:MAG: hypothetical protein A2W91_01330 [Bacteroidetes bacterium GWF2_38_335]OFY80958.1 MAG: hypothetical protein A2281_12935 [Bacteroidetes bacterium RIFOXYA12_FULL_38_20]HBS85105.1 hypothetical protein [Bacteroidales bacterium]
MKYIAGLLIPFYILCGNVNPELISAESQKWTAGISSGGSGVNYKIILKLNSSNTNFDVLWTGNEKLEIKVNKYGSKPGIQETPEKGDTVVITATRRILPDYKQTEEKEKISIPEFQGEGLIEYHVGNKSKGLVIEKFEEKKPLKYQ